MNIASPLIPKIADDGLPTPAPEQFVGWVYQATFHEARVLTNDAWLASNPTPLNSLLLARQSQTGHQETLLLQVTGFGSLPLSEELLQTRLQQLQERTSPEALPDACDPITQSQLQYSELRCSILGTFYLREDRLHFGADRSRCAAAETLNVYRLAGDELAHVINFFPRQLRRSLTRLAAQLGHPIQLQPIEIGRVRFTAAWHACQAEARIEINPADFLATRTMVVGQTRSGKSNGNKLLISRLQPAFARAGIPMAFLILDVNGEYGSDNVQDGQSLASLFPDLTVQYSLLPRQGFLPLANNFYLQHREALAIFRRVLRENKTDGQPDMATYLGTCFDPPDRNDWPAYTRWEVKVAAHQAMLYRAGFAVPPDFTITFSANAKIRKQVEEAARRALPDPSDGLSPDDAVEWFLAARSANRLQPLMTQSNKPWCDTDLQSILNLLAQANSAGSYITGYKLLIPARRYHAPHRSREVCEEIYQWLSEGKLVIIDLALGDPVVRSRLVEQLASEIFNRNLALFTNGQLPTPLTILVEESHNLLGRDMQLSDPWPRLAKEGSKLGTGLILATQEPSSLHRDVLANAENILAFHISSSQELNLINTYHGLGAFETTNAPEPGWARMKLLSNDFALPVQMDLFEVPDEDPELPPVVAARRNSHAVHIG